MVNCFDLKLARTACLARLYLGLWRRRRASEKRDAIGIILLTCIVDFGIMSLLRVQTEISWFLEQCYSVRAIKAHRNREAEW